MDVVSSFAWIAWLVLILVFLIVEMLTIQLTFLMVAIGCIGGLVSGLLGIHWWFQLLIAAIIAVLLLFTIRPWLLRVLKRGGDPAKSNVAALKGIDGHVVLTITRTDGQVRLANGETWTARVTADVEHRDLKPGEHVVVTAIDGATAFVAPAEENT